MSENRQVRAAQEPGRRASGLAAWLGGRTVGRPACGRSQWVKTVLTAALLVTGLSAWAIAVVQPWAARTGDPGIIALPAANVTAQKVKSVAEEAERLCTEWHRRTAPGLRRNPFVAAGAEGPSAEAPQADPVVRDTLYYRADPLAVAGVEPEDSSVLEVVGGDGSTVAELLSAVKALRLEVTLTAAGGEPWAVIDGHDYRVGDTVAGMEIVEIGEGRVRLKQGTVTCLLRMP
ncbi:MAG: hypothetical protein WBD63_05010 [Phycisphaerae bacterium]|nr:hypothetical protein [Phycisphaerae bacterium]